MAKLVRHLTSNEEIVGSNPAESISFCFLLQVLIDLSTAKDFQSLVCGHCYGTTLFVVILVSNQVVVCD